MLFLLLAALQAAPSVADPSADTKVWTPADFAGEPSEKAGELYPAAALRAGDQGSTIAGLAVNAAGRVDRCWTIKSSGSAVLDEASCRQLLKRARFDPAKDGGGRPVGTNLSVPIKWVLPE